MNPEIFEYIESKLFDLGALDVFKTPILMKKSRLATKLSVLAKQSDLKKIREIIFRETTAGGTREYLVQKHMMEKAYRIISTKYGPIQVKDYSYNGQLIKSKVEYDFCKKIAKKKKLNIQHVYNEAVKVMENE